MERPTIFISSTVHDFGDLRGALKDHLEARGCAVLASEFNDFPKPLDRHSYEACLKTIEQADLFVLLIGSRVGGWFDETQRISITRAEYRHAYRLAQTGKLRILTFVRDEVWNHRQSVKELKKALAAERRLREEQRTRLANHDTLFATDAASIISFIDEVSRNRETVAASRGQGAMPVANWIHTFKGFRDIRQAIDPLILSGLSVQGAARRHALLTQVLAMLQGMTPAFDGKPILPAAAIRRIGDALDLKGASALEDVTVDGTTWGRLVMLSTLASKRPPQIGHLADVLSSDLLLAYDPAASRFRETLEYELLADVLNLADKLTYLKGADLADILQYGQRINAQEDRRVPAHLLATQLHRLYRFADLIATAKALCLALDGRPVAKPEPMPRTAFFDQISGLEAEEASLAQIRTWVGLDEPREAPAAPSAAASSSRSAASARKVAVSRKKPASTAKKTSGDKVGIAKPPKKKKKKRSG